MATDNNSILASLRHKSEVVVYGYIRNIENQMDDRIIPDGVVKLFVEYYFNIGVYFICSQNVICNILDNNEWRQTLQYPADTGSPSNTSDLAICHSTQKMTLSGHGDIFKWSFLCKGHDYNDMIGIIPKLDGIDDWTTLSDINCWFWWKNDGIWNEGRRYDADWIGSWNKNDRITVNLNTTNWTLIFEKNNEKVFETIKLNNANIETEFYAFIVLGDSESKYIHIV